MNRSFTTERRNAWAYAEKKAAHITSESERKKKEIEYFESEYERQKQITISKVERQRSGRAKTRTHKQFLPYTTGVSCAPCSIEKIRTYA